MSNAIRSFNASNLDEVDAAIKAALEPVTKQFGIQLTVTAAVVTSPVSGKFTISADVDLGDGLTATEREFRVFATAHGLAPDDFGKSFWFKRERYTIAGINLNAPRFAVNATRASDGKTFRFPADTVKGYLR
jgi:hypothetical protein